MRTEYQLVFQFPERAFPTRDEIVAFEDRLRASLPRTCEVDGFDVGSGTVNFSVGSAGSAADFFVYTSAPASAHRAFREHLGTRAIERHLRIAYRDVDGETFTNLWPRRDPRPFRFAYPPSEDPFARGAKRVIPKRSPRKSRTA